MSWPEDDQNPWGNHSQSDPDWEAIAKSFFEQPIVPAQERPLHQSSSSAWVTNTGLDMNRFDKFANIRSGLSTHSPYYVAQVELTRLLGNGHEMPIELGIAGRKAERNAPFFLCNMQEWSLHYWLKNPWPLVLTAAVGVMNHYAGENSLRLSPPALAATLNPLGIETKWLPGSTWDSVGTRVEAKKVLRHNFPLAARSAQGIENPSFAALAEYKDLHLSALLYLLTTLTEIPNQAEQYYG